jgi:amyloid beta precursor protein binding protein 1
MNNTEINKYDRQLRLWASTGQYNLENSHICLINGTATGSEILKNMVLPGIGKFTLIDDVIVDDSCLLGNFFLSKSNLGQFRAESICKKLVELNNDVKGRALCQPIDKVIEKNPQSWWDQFNVVIVSDNIPNLSGLIDILWQRQVPLLLVNTLGYYGSVNLIANEVTVIETHDPLKLYDLRIDKPWAELQQYVDSIDLDTLDEVDHAHVPYIVIYIKAMNHWKDDHNGMPPTSYTDKKEFKTYIEDMANNKFKEENFTEALNTIHRALQSTKIPPSIHHLFQSSILTDLSSKTPIFWIYVQALKQFVEISGTLPLSGNLPDMVSDTAGYIKIQTLYREKAAKDLEIFSRQVKQILDSLGRPESDATEESMKSFCKNSQLLYVTVGSKETVSESLIRDLFASSDDNDNDSCNMLAIYFSIYTYNKYVEIHKKPPKIDNFDSFIDLFVSEFHIKQLLTPNILSTFREALIHNTRSYHNMNSLMGGIVSQEVLKLTTGQYTPLDNLFVFDGIRSMSSKWKI